MNSENMDSQNIDSEFINPDDFLYKGYHVYKNNAEKTITFDIAGGKDIQVFEFTGISNNMTIDLSDLPKSL